MGWQIVAAGGVLLTWPFYVVITEVGRGDENDLIQWIVRQPLQRLLAIRASVLMSLSTISLGLAVVGL